MPQAVQPVSVAGIEFDALLSSAESYEAEVPVYPTEDGFVVSDTVVVKQNTLEMTLFVTPLPVTWRGRLGGSDRVEDVEKRLYELFIKKEPVTVTTSDKTYENMAIVSFSYTKDVQTGYAREIPIRFAEISITETEMTEMDGDSEKSGGTTNTGSASTSDEQETEERTSTVAYNIYGLFTGGGLNSLLGA